MSNIAETLTDGFLVVGVRGRFEFVEQFLNIVSDRRWDMPSHQAFEALEFLDRAQAARGAKFAYHFVFAALIVRRRPESAGRGGLQFDPFDIAVKREVEIEPGLLTIRDDVQAGGHLVMDRAN